MFARRWAVPALAPGCQRPRTASADSGSEKEAATTAHHHSDMQTRSLLLSAQERQQSLYSFNPATYIRHRCASNKLTAKRPDEPDNQLARPAQIAVAPSIPRTAPSSFRRILLCPLMTFSASSMLIAHVVGLRYRRMCRDGSSVAKVPTSCSRRYCRRQSYWIQNRRFQGMDGR